MTTRRDDGNKDYCDDEVMMVRSRKRRKTATRMDFNMDYCCEEEKEDNKDMDVCMVPILRYIVHRTQHGMLLLLSEQIV